MSKEREAALIRMEQLHLLRCIAHRRLLSAQPLYRGQPPMLEYILRNPGCTQAEIAERFLISPASVAQSTKRMERAGLLEKRMDPQNQRCRRLYATDTGSAVMARCGALLQEADERMLAGFTDAQIAQLDGYLRRMLENIAPIAQVDPETMDRFSFFALLHKVHSTEIRKERGDV